MTTRKLAALNGVLFFCFWLLVLLAGADKPPPPGFLWLVLLLALCALAVVWRVPAYLDWQRTRQPRRIARVVMDGLSAGFVAASLAMFVSALDGAPGGEPSVTPAAIDIFIWFVVLAVMGILNALFIYAANAFMAQRFLDSVSGS